MGIFKYMMDKKGFPNNFKDLVMRCIVSVSYSVLVNGCPSTSFLPSRDL